MNVLTKCEVVVFCGCFFVFFGGGLGHQKFVILFLAVFKVVFSYFQALFCFDVTKKIILYVK